MILATINRDGSLGRYPLTLREVRNLKNINLPPDPSDEQLAKFGLVRVREESAVTGIGNTVAEAAPTKEADGHWHQQWTVTPPDQAQVDAIKAGMEADVWQAVERKLLDEAPDGRGPLTASAEMVAQGASHPVRQKALSLIPDAEDIIQRIRAASTLEEAATIRDEIEAA